MAYEYDYNAKGQDKILDKLDRLTEEKKELKQQLAAAQEQLNSLHRRWVNTDDEFERVRCERDELQRKLEAIRHIPAYKVTGLGKVVKVVRQSDIEKVLGATQPPLQQPSREQVAVAVLLELVHLMQGVIDGEYAPDSHTLQPARSFFAQYPELQALDSTNNKEESSE
jgi:predicted nuclease with TOPRIM domain